MPSPIPSHRIDLAEHAARQYAAMSRLQGTVELEPRLHELVKIRASQINGCAFCLDMHTKDARAAGESEDRIYLLDAWREAPHHYDERERAALALCEVITRIADGPLDEDVWARAEAVFGTEELAQLVFAIVAINAWNRIAISAGSEPGHYEPGMFERAA